MSKEGQICLQNETLLQTSVTVHAYVPSNGICRGFASQYGKFLLPPRFLTALSAPKVPTREQFQKAGICEKHGKLKCLHKRATYDIICRTLYTKKMKEDIEMKHVKTLSASTLKNSMKKGGCGECQTSCQSACKTSCTVGNQSCENQNR